MDSKFCRFIIVSLMFIFCVTGFSPLLYCQEKGFPFPDEISGWKAADEPQFFIGDELFELINGGAEVYHEYGFVRVDTMDYLSGDDMISVEAYTMNDSAFGIFTSLTTEEDQRLEIGNGSTFSDYYLMMWQGNVLFAITAQFENDKTESILKSFATTFAGLVKPGNIPEMIGILPRENRVAGSEKHIVGHLGLQNIFDLGSRLLSGFEEGVAAKYENGDEEYVLIVLKQENESAAHGGIATAVEKAKDMSGVSATMDQSLLTLDRGDGNNVFAAAQGKYIKIILASTISPESIEKILRDH